MSSHPYDKQQYTLQNIIAKIRNLLYSEENEIQDRNENIFEINPVRSCVTNNIRTRRNKNVTTNCIKTTSESENTRYKNINETYSGKSDYEYIDYDDIVIKIQRKMLQKLNEDELTNIIESIKVKRNLNNKSKVIYIEPSEDNEEEDVDDDIHTNRENDERENMEMKRVQRNKHWNMIRNSVTTQTKYRKSKPDNSMKLKRDKRGRSEDILHDCVCYSQSNIPIPSTRTQSRSEAINAFLNTITNDIIDDNKELVPKDPLTRPALGTAGMYPTRKWIAELKRRGIKPEPGKHYKKMNSNVQHESMKIKKERGSSSSSS